MYYKQLGLSYYPALQGTTLYQPRNSIPEGYTLRQDSKHEPIDANISRFARCDHPAH